MKSGSNIFGDARARAFSQRASTSSSRARKSATHTLVYIASHRRRVSLSSHRSWEHPTLVKCMASVRAPLEHVLDTHTGGRYLAAASCSKRLSISRQPFVSTSNASRSEYLFPHKAHPRQAQKHARRNIELMGPQPLPSAPQATLGRVSRNLCSPLEDHRSAGRCTPTGSSTTREEVD